MEEILTIYELFERICKEDKIEIRISKEIEIII